MLGEPSARRLQPACARPPPGSHGSQFDVAIVVSFAEGEAHLEVVGRKHRLNHVSPLDEYDASAVEKLGKVEVHHFGHLLEPVHIEMMEWKST